MTQDTEKDLKAETSEGGADPKDQGDKAQDLTKIQEQIANLNKGIATSREEAKTAKAQAEALKKQLAEFQSKVEFEAEDEKVELHPDDVKKLDAWARKQGLVTKTELDAENQRKAAESHQSIAQTAIDEFIASHKEYDDDAKWKEVAAEFNQFYKAPTTLAGYRKILEKIHKDLGGTNDEDVEARAKAKIANNSRLSLGGGSQKASNSEQTVEDLHKKYPHLSREQIEARVAEIKSLYKK